MPKFSLNKSAVDKRDAAVKKVHAVYMAAVQAAESTELHALDVAVDKAMAEENLDAAAEAKVVKDEVLTRVATEKDAEKNKPRYTVWAVQWRRGESTKYGVMSDHTAVDGRGYAGIWTSTVDGAKTVDK